MRKSYLFLLTGLLFFLASNKLAAQPCAATAPVTFTNSTSIPIADVAVTTSTLVVSGAPTYLYNLQMVTNILHTFAADMDITLTSPAGTVVTLSTDNGAGNDNVFNGTTWRDNANPGGQVPYTANNGLAGDNTYANLVTATPLAPEEPFGAFIGENPNGTWTLRISDDLGGDAGTLTSWSLTMRGVSVAPSLSPFTATNNTPVVIPTTISTVSSTINVAGAGNQIFDLNLITNITHTFNGDIDMTLMSPAGTIVTITTDNGGGFDNVFNGTTWDDDANPLGQVPYSANQGLVSDHTYTNLVVATPLTPEEPLAAFIGENPNGVWTLTISDDAGGDGGSLSSWTLNFQTSECVPPPCVITCPANIIVSNDAGVCGAVVSYPGPSGTGECGNFTSTPASGSIFPVGTTTVTQRSDGLYSQLNAYTPGDDITSQDFNAGLDQFDSRAADDFRVPSGQTWGITRIAVNGVNLGSPVTSINVTFYADAGGLPGAVVADYPGLTSFSGDPNFIVTLPAPASLTGGASGTIYWVSVQVVLPSGQWFWGKSGGASDIRSEYAFQNPGGGFAPACTSYGYGVTTCGNAGSHNLNFALYGTGGTNGVCTFTIRVNDTQAPTITCPANITVASASGTCGANVTLPAPTIADNCPGATFTYTPASGSFFPVGTTNVTGRVTDASGNTASCGFTVTVNDVTPPVITCPANIVVPNAANQCGAVVTFTTNATDNCATIALTQSTSTAITTFNSVSCNAGGVHRDNSYWRAYQLAAPAPVTLSSVVFGIEVANASGTGTTQPIIINLYTSAGAFPGAARTLVKTQTFQIPDQSGTLFTATLTGTPVTVPGNAILVVELNSPDAQTLGHSFFIGSNAAAETGPSYLSAAACGIATPTTTAAIGFPNMHIILNVNGFLGVPVVSTPASGSFFPVGTTTVTSTATDASGNTSTCSFTVRVNDTQAPAITCPANITATTPIGSCVATVNYTVTSADNCPGVTQALVSGQASGSAFPLGVTTNVWRATDAAGNTTTCSFTITVLDGNIPVIGTQPATKTVCETTNTTFSVAATSGSPLAYQWQLFSGGTWNNVTNGGVYSGATTNTLTITGVNTGLNTNSYRVQVIGLCTTVTSGFATLYVNKLPQITLVGSIPPQLLPWDILTITASTIPSGGTFVWFKNGVVIPGVTGDNLSGLTVDDVGTYKAVYTDPNGCVMTSADFVVSGLPSDNLFVYPNPNTGAFQVRYYTNASGQPLNLRIYDSKGALVYQSQTLSTVSPYTSIPVDLGSRPAGTYMIDLRDASGKALGNRKVLIWPR
jgi:subtilisin-like proprotein convertase family protein